MAADDDNPQIFVAGICLKPDLRNLEIVSRSVEKMLEPLVKQVTTLVTCDGPSKKRKGISKKASVLVATVEAATDHYITNCTEIAKETPEIEVEMMKAIDELKKEGSEMSKSSRDFTNDPCTSQKRLWMEESARQLLFAACRVLILADMVDIIALLKSLPGVETAIDQLKDASSIAELNDRYNNFQKTASELLQKATNRQNDLKDPRLRDELAAARATLVRSSDMLYTASKAYIRHPELASAKANRDFLLKEAYDAMTAISDIARGKLPESQVTYHSRPGILEGAISDFENSIRIDPMEYNEVVTRPSLEEQLEALVNGAAGLADSFCTRDDNKLKIVQECDNVRHALQNLLSEYMDNAGKSEPNPELLSALDDMYSGTNKLRRRLRMAAMDHVSDKFLSTTNPLEQLVTSAYAGDEDAVEEYAEIFQEHVNQIIEVAQIACDVSENEEGVAIVHAICEQLKKITPQVINASKVLVYRPKSKPAQENMEAFKNAWEKQINLLTDAIDDVVSIDDFLAVSETHILDDVKRCIIAINDKDAETLKEVSESIKGRSKRVCDAVEGEMDDYEPCPYTDNVLQAVQMLRNQVLPLFNDETYMAVDRLGDPNDEEFDGNEFISASHFVYDGVREVRMAVLATRNPQDLELDETMSINDGGSSVLSKAKSVEAIDEYPEVEGINNVRDAMKNLPEEEKVKIAEQVETFNAEKTLFDKEVARWDDSNNDIVMIAKHMCLIMMQMTDFTIGEGPLKSSMDVINAATKISEAGRKLDKNGRQLAAECPESRTKDDLGTFLDRVSFYCHQLSITSKVKADVQSTSGHLKVTGLDSATSLIQASKNLMSAVVQTVKSSYVASTKYSKLGTVKPLIWKMKPPEKKPLVMMERLDQPKSRVRRDSQKKPESALKALSEFQL